uniref:Uncharacterized protein n=1 Tax=Setaria italica TaxID=4555 RepID=K4A3M5_SETIT
MCLKSSILLTCDQRSEAPANFRPLLLLSSSSSRRSSTS